MHGRIVASLAATLALISSIALARPATYQCGEDREVKIDFTPRKGHSGLLYAIVRVVSPTGTGDVAVVASVEP